MDGGETRRDRLRHSGHWRADMIETFYICGRASAPTLCEQNELRRADSERLQTQTDDERTASIYSQASSKQDKESAATRGSVKLGANMLHMTSIIFKMLLSMLAFVSNLYLIHESWHQCLWFNTILRWLAFLNKLELNFLLLLFLQWTPGGLKINSITKWSMRRSADVQQSPSIRELAALFGVKAPTSTIFWASVFGPFACISFSLLTAAVTVKDLSSSVWHQH